MRRTLASTFALLGCGLLIAWAEAEVRVEASPETPWVVTKMIARGREIPLPVRPVLSLSFSATGTVSGHSGINHFSAGYRKNGKTIEWTTAFRSTRKGGPKELQELETAFMNVLQRCTSIGEQETLVLTGKEGSLHFQRPAAKR